MRILLNLAAIGIISGAAFAKTSVFWQPGFPSIESPAIEQKTLANALGVTGQAFLDLDALRQEGALSDTDLLVLPYGSAFPSEGWPSILRYLRHGGNLLVIGGRPFRVPVTKATEGYAAGQPEDAFERELGAFHTYDVPQPDAKTFAWKDGYSFLPAVKVDAREFFVLQGRTVDGLGYMLNAAGEKIAAPVVVSNHTSAYTGEMLRARWVYLDFQPPPGYWNSNDGVALMAAAATYARQGAASFWIETQFSTYRRGEVPEIIVHLRTEQKGQEPLNETHEVTIELVSRGAVVAQKHVICSSPDVNVDFGGQLDPGFYVLRGTYRESGQPREFYQNGFWVAGDELVKSGPTLGIAGDFLTMNQKPFFPFGTNYFSTEENGWDFSGPRNAAVWESDFAEMERHNVSFVRTGVWGGQFKFLNQDGGVPERFLRNVEAYLLCARQHNIAP